MIFCNNFCKFYNSKSSNNFCEGQGSCGALFHFASCCASSEACAGAISAAARMVGKCPAKFLGQGRNQTWQSRWQGSRVHANTCLCRYCIHIYIYIHNLISILNTVSERLVRCKKRLFLHVLNMSFKKTRVAAPKRLCSIAGRQPDLCLAHGPQPSTQDPWWRKGSTSSQLSHEQLLGKIRSTYSNQKNK